MVFTAPQDIIALVVQGVGGGIASESQNSQSQANLVRAVLFYELSDRLNVRPWHYRVLTLLLAAPSSSYVCVKLLSSSLMWKLIYSTSGHHRVLYVSG